MVPYSFDVHCHNYAVWTAARAVQRGFTTTSNIKDAIENSDLKSFLVIDSVFTEYDFENFHRVCCRQLIKYLKTKVGKKATYGRAAKIIAIYLKTAVIIAHRARGKNCELIHPPIDNILLNNLCKAKKIDVIKQIKWTTLTEKGYWQMVKDIKSVVKRFDWTLEEFWQP